MTDWHGSVLQALHGDGHYRGRCLRRATIGGLSLDTQYSSLGCICTAGGLKDASSGHVYW